jgi:hypothetical protein
MYIVRDIARYIRSAGPDNSLTPTANRESRATRNKIEDIHTTKEDMCD